MDKTEVEDQIEMLMRVAVMSLPGMAIVLIVADPDTSNAVISSTIEENTTRQLIKEFIKHD